jgi:uncharacterized protein with PIN domain
MNCQRCGTPMEMRDPAPGAAWAPQQFWVCPRCARHFWTTYATATPAPKKEEAKKEEAPSAAAPVAS